MIFIRCHKPLMVFVLSALMLFVVPAQAKETQLGYDPDANPNAQLRALTQLAQAGDKRILLIAGGDWCLWCHFLDDFLNDHPQIYSQLRETFVIGKIYYGDEGDNSEFFTNLPPAAGYPHFWILDANGTLLHSQNTLPLEDGAESYSRHAFVAFIQRWQQP